MSLAGLGGTACLDSEGLVKAVSGVQEVSHLIECRCLILDSFGLEMSSRVTDSAVGTNRADMSICSEKLPQFV